VCLGKDYYYENNMEGTLYRDFSTDQMGMYGMASVLEGTGDDRHIHTAVYWGLSFDRMKTLMDKKRPPSKKIKKLASVLLS